jgi:hypothetical protein
MAVLRDHGRGFGQVASAIDATTSRNHAPNVGELIATTHRRQTAGQGRSVSVRGITFSGGPDHIIAADLDSKTPGAIGDSLHPIGALRLSLRQSTFRLHDSRKH